MKKTAKAISVLCQRWYWQNSAEYERAGVSFHLSKRAHTAFMREFAKGQQRHYLKYRSVPGTYLYPEKEPFWCEVSADVLNKFGKAKSVRIHNSDDCEKLVGEAVLAQERKESEERGKKPDTTLGEMLNQTKKMLDRELLVLEKKLARKKNDGGRKA